ncbi:MAG: alpha/beta hydrolase [Pseudomonadota bacterium]
MATYVFIHNGFAGGWVWQDVAISIKNKKHHIYTPTLTGLAERAHLANPQTDLNDHICDIVDLIDGEGIKDIILVASSWGGMVATGVADSLSDRISRLVYIDSLIPDSGQSWLELLPPQFSDYIKRIVDKDGDGWRIPVYRSDAPRWTDHPFKSVTQPVILNNTSARKIPRTFIHCTGKPMDYHYGMTPCIARHAERSRRKNWGYFELKTVHLAMLSMPKELSEILLGLA